MKVNSITCTYKMQNYRSDKPNPAMEKTEKGYDHISLSEEAVSFSKTINEIKSRISDRSKDERERINDIRDRIKRGEYEVCSDLVAEKILLHFQN